MTSSAVMASVLAWMMTYAAISGAAESPDTTVISINGMHCISCASKVKKKLLTVPNVKSASVDPEKGSAVVVSAKGKDVSPKAIWESIEAAGYEPTELKGPAGTFKDKPTK